MMFYAPSRYHEWDAHRRYQRARQHQIAMDRERERCLREREYARRLAQRRRANATAKAIAMQRRRAHEDELRRQHQHQRHRHQAPQAFFSPGFSDPFFKVAFTGLGHPSRSRAMPYYRDDEEDVEDEASHHEADTPADMQLDNSNSMKSIHESDTDEQDEGNQEKEEEKGEDKTDREQDKMFAYMTKKIRSMRRRRKSDADFNPEALMNLAESELNWLMNHEALRCEENARENHVFTAQDMEAYQKLVLTFLRVYVCENILDTVSRDNFPPKPEDENEDEAVGEMYYVLDVERRRNLHRLAARLEKEFE